VNGAMRAVGGEDGGAHVSADLRLAECAWSARARLVLQRSRRAVPSLVPSADGLRSTCHCEAASESGELALTHTCAVVGEDAVLVLRSELAHAWWRAEEETRGQSGERRHWQCKAGQGVTGTEISLTIAGQKNVEPEEHVRYG
jgi:hypothetical protein